MYLMSLRKKYNILQIRSPVGSPETVLLIPYTDLLKTEFKEVLMSYAFVAIYSDACKEMYAFCVIFDSGSNPVHFWV